MSKSILFSICFFFYPIMANAEYMGIEEVPVSESEINTVFLSSVKGKDFKAIEKWKDQIQQVYDQTGFCIFDSSVGIPASNVKKKMGELDVNSREFSNFMSTRYSMIVPSNCDSVSLWSIYDKLPNPQYSYDIFKSTNTLSKLDKSHVVFAEEYEHKRDIIIDFINKIPQDKYELFIPLIFDNDADFRVRNIALDKYLEHKKNKDQEGYKDLNSLMREKFRVGALENKNWNNNFENKTYMSLINPDLLILTEMNRKVLDTLYVYWSYYKTNDGVLPPFSKSVIAKGGYTDEELKKMNLKSLDEISLYRLYNTNQVIRLFHRAFNNYIESHDLNVQDDYGNTMLSDMILKEKYKLGYSPFSGSFIRFYLESGANPLLQNKDGNTAFSEFVKKYGDNPETFEVKKAFVQKEYDFDKNDIK